MKTRAGWTRARLTQAPAWLHTRAQLLSLLAPLPDSGADVVALDARGRTLESEHLKPLVQRAPPGLNGNCSSDFF